MTKDTQKTMLEILEHLKDRLWIPGHVIYEYKKNRIEVIKEPIGKYYGSPDFFSNNYMQQMEQFIQRIEEQDYYHPYFDKIELANLKKLKKDVSELMKHIREAVYTEFEKRKTEIQNQVKLDDIFEKVLLLPLGEEFPYAEKLMIMREGEWRYKQKLPPGYMDFEKKYGIQKYGDLIIWKEILNKAKADNCSVIFVTNDVKEDWYEVYPKKQSVVCPRHELLLEFSEITGKDVWLYTLDQFVGKLEIMYKDKTSLPFYTGLEAVKQVLVYAKRQKELEEKLKKARWVRVTCGNCDHHFVINENDFDFCWEAASEIERGMGPETEYKCTEVFNCPQCGNECCVTFHVWEYPVGAYNYDDIESEGCIIQKEDINILEHISFEDKESQCVRCGMWGATDENDLCTECVNELEEYYKESV